MKMSKIVLIKLQQKTLLHIKTVFLPSPDYDLDYVISRRPKMDYQNWIIFLDYTFWTTGPWV